MLNNICIAGRLTANPELRHTPNNVPVTTFVLAVDRDFKDKDGKRESDFLPIVCWRGTAEFVSRFFEKGRIAIVNGRLQVRDYTDKDGNKRRITEIVADNVYFGDSKRETQQFAPVDDDTNMDDVFQQQTGRAIGNTEDNFNDDDTLPF